jgi:ribosomal protein S12 methylthiotransferase accessory factor
MNLSSLPKATHILDLADDLIDEAVGIINVVQEVPPEAGAPAFFHYYARSCNTKMLGNHPNFAHTGGASVCREIAYAKAMGEAVERYCSAIYVPQDLPLSSFDAATFLCVQPDTFALYRHGQYAGKGFPFVQFTAKTPIRWAPAKRLDTSGTYFVPAVMVFAPYFIDCEDDEQPIAQSISTGLACHMSYAQAAIAGICEVIERDAFTITWQAKLSRPKLRLDTLSDANRDAVSRFERAGSEVTLIDITMEHGIPTILSILKNSHFDAPALVFAAAADLSPEDAVRKSLEELSHTRRLAQILKNQQPSFRPTRNYANVNNQDSHVNLYCDARNASMASFITASSEFLDFQKLSSATTGDHEQDLTNLVQSIAELGHTVYVADLTSEDVRDLGLSVVRAIIPGFHPLFMGHQLRALGGTRLWEAPHRLGFTNPPKIGRDNPAPHPFP